MPKSLWVFIGGAVAVAGLVWAVVAHFSSDARTRVALAAEREWSAAVLPEIRNVTDRPKLKKSSAAGALKVLADEKKMVVRAVQGAVDDPTVKVTWSSAAEQIDGIGADWRGVRIELADVNYALDQMAARAVAAENNLAERRAIDRKAAARRDEMARELSRLDLTAEEEGEYTALDRQARRAMTILRESGL